MVTAQDIRQAFPHRPALNSMVQLALSKKSAGDGFAMPESELDDNWYYLDDGIAVYFDINSVTIYRDGHVVIIK